MRNNQKYISWVIFSVALFLIFFVVGFQLGQNPQEPLMTTIQEKSTVIPNLPTTTVQSEINISATETQEMTSTVSVSPPTMTDTPTVTLQPTLIENFLCVVLVQTNSTMIGLLNQFDIEYNKQTTYSRCELREENNDKVCTSAVELYRNPLNGDPILLAGTYIIIPGVNQNSCVNGRGAWVLDETHP